MGASARGKSVPTLRRRAAIIFAIGLENRRRLN